MNSTNEEYELPFPDIERDKHWKIFGFFSVKEMQPWTGVSKAWQAFIPKAQFEILHEDLKWFVKEGHVDLKVALQIQSLWDMDECDRVAHLPQWLREELESEEVPQNFGIFLCSNYALLALIGRFITTAQACAMPDHPEFVRVQQAAPGFNLRRPLSDHLEALMCNVWGIKMLALKIITPEMAANFKSFYGLMFLLHKGGLIGLEKGVVTIEEVSNYESDKDCFNLKYKLSEYGILAYELGCFDLKEAQIIVCCNLPRSEWNLPKKEEEPKESTEEPIVDPSVDQEDPEKTGLFK